MAEDEEKATSSGANEQKTAKRGIIYLSTIPPYMNVTTIREYFGQFGTIGRVYLQLATSNKTKDKKKKTKKFTEGWVEFERKSVAKKVVQLLNNTQVNNRKKSKQYDCIWNMKYLSNFKWTHLHERLAYERAARKQKLRAEIQLAKKKTNFFTSNLGKKKKGKKVTNKEFEALEQLPEAVEEPVEVEERSQFLQSLFE